MDLVHPDPLEFLYRYETLQDREIAGLLASCLAYGRVPQILKSISRVLGRMGTSPADYLRSSNRTSLARAFDGFRHRFTTGKELSCLLLGAKDILENHGSLGAFFSGLPGHHESTLAPALSRFAKALCSHLPQGPSFIFPDPERGSACKRPFLFLRWMVRKDAVDPGGWDLVSPAGLVIPMDTHMYKVARLLGFTRRKNVDLATAIEVTRAFAAVCPEDPVKYDFALTRFGIRPELDQGLLERWIEKGPPGRPRPPEEPYHGQRRDGLK